MQLRLFSMIHHQLKATSTICQTCGHPPSIRFMLLRADKVFFKALQQEDYLIVDEPEVNAAPQAEVNATLQAEVNAAPHAEAWLHICPVCGLPPRMISLFAKY